MIINKYTEVNINKIPYSISLKDNIFSAGSCFSDEIFKYLYKNGISVFSNPFGTIYNIYSIYKLFELLYSKKKYTKNDLYNMEGIFFSFDHSTLFDSGDCQITLDKLNDNINFYYEKLIKSTIFIITPGTAVVYVLKENGLITANCHKLNNNIFEKRILSVDDNILYLKKTIEIIKKINKNAKIILTISPVRHYPSDLVANSLSKAILRVALSHFVNNIDISYFPSSEIVLDELRNYEFYSSDNFHIAKKTVDYIMNKFRTNYFSNNINDFIENFNKIRRFRKHKPKGPESETYYNLLVKNINSLILLYNKNKSSKIEIELFNLFKIVLKFFYDKDEILDLINKNLKELDYLKQIFTAAYYIQNKLDIFIDLEEILNMSNDKKIVKYIKKILRKYYLSKKEYDKLIEL